jgi:hypothetical protein
LGVGRGSCPFPLAVILVYGVFLGLWKCDKKVRLNEVLFAKVENAV